MEAERCIQCPAAPCIKACPVGNDIPGALWLLEQGKFDDAADVFRETSELPEMCGRLCPQERLCEGHCVVGKKALPVAIGKLETFTTEWQRAHGGPPQPSPVQPSGRSVRDRRQRPGGHRLRRARGARRAPGGDPRGVAGAGRPAALWHPPLQAKQGRRHPQVRGAGGARRGGDHRLTRGRGRDAGESSAAARRPSSSASARSSAQRSTSPASTHPACTPPPSSWCAPTSTPVCSPTGDAPAAPGHAARGRDRRWRHLHGPACAPPRGWGRSR